MALRGQHFYIDDFENGVGPMPESKPAPVNPFDFIGDVQERQTATPKPPQPPSLRNTSSGFPAHRKRNIQSKFRQSRQEASGQNAPPTIPPQDTTPTNLSKPGDDQFMTSERHRIDQENKQRLAEMSPDEIEEERAELLKALGPSLIERFLGKSALQEVGRAVIDQGGSDADFPGLEPEPEVVKPKDAKPRKSVKFAEPAQDSEHHVGSQVSDVGQASSSSSSSQQSRTPAVIDKGTLAAAEEALPIDSTIHFPSAPQPPSLDPSSDTFLEDLHDKYFPSLPEDPDKLEWMRAAPENTYSASQKSLDPKDIRFSFTGTLIPPKLAAEIPVTAGLHHHGDAPDAAGYTIPELAMLARSSVAAQRCMSFQTLGRLLYRLGKGEFGNPGDGSAGTVGAEDTLGELARSLWGEVEREGVIEICVAESEGKVAGGRHVSARAYATEAVWLWQKGGGRRWKAA